MRSLRLSDLVAAEPVSAKPRGRGRRLPGTIERLDRRDELLRAAAAEFFPHAQSFSEAAFLLHRALTTYRAAGWRADRAVPELPQRIRGTVRAFCWQIFRVHDVAPPQPDTIRKILARAAFHCQRSG